MKRSLALFSGLYIFFSGCMQAAKTPLAVIPGEQIDLVHYKEVEVAQLPSEYIRQRQYINLAMQQDENYVKMVSKVTVRKDKVYVLDKRARLLVVYDTTGAFVGMVGKPDQEYLNIADFDIADDGTVYLIDGKQDKILRYDAQFRLVYTKPTPFEIDIVKSLPGESLLLGLSSWNTRELAHDKVIRTNQKLDPEETILRYDDYVDDNFWITGYRFLQTDSLLFYNRPIDNKVYVFGRDGKARKYYAVDFGPMNVPDEDKREIEGKVARYDGYRLLSEFTYVNDRFILGKLWDRRKFRAFYADRVQRVLYIEDLAHPDEWKNLADFDGQVLTTFIYPGEYNEQGFREISPAAREHLQRGGLVLCRYTLN